MKNNYDFNVSITCRHEECNLDFKESIKKQIQKLSKYYSHIIDSNVILDKQNSSFKVEISLHVPGLVITAKHEDYDRIKALDISFEKVKKQLKKLKSKVVDHRVSQTIVAAEEENTEEVDDLI